MEGLKPFQYQGNYQNPQTDFTTTPASTNPAVGNAIKDLGDDFTANNERQAVAEKVAKAREAFEKAFASGDHREVTKAILANPVAAKAWEISEVYTWGQDQDEQAGKELRERVYMDKYQNLAEDNPPVAIARLGRLLDHMDKVDAPQTAKDEIAEMIDMWRTDPKAAKKASEGYLAAVDGDRFKKFQDAQGGGDDQYEGLTGGYEEFLRVYDLKKSPESFAKYNEVEAANKEMLRKQAEPRPHITQLMADGWMPTGRITAPQMDALEAGAAQAAAQGTPWTVKKLRRMEFDAVENKGRGRTAGSRNIIMRKQNIKAAMQLLPEMKATAAKLNYSDAKFIGALEKFKKGQFNDPLFTEYMTQRSDSLFILGNALKQNGLTDKSIEVEEEAFNPVLSPPAFNAWYNVQIRALNRAAEEMEDDFYFEMPTMPSVPAAQGGQPTPLPSGVTEADVQAQMKRYSIDREEVIRRYSGGN